MIRTYGTVAFDPAMNEWVISCEAQVSLRLKRVFEKISKGQFGTIRLAATNENSRELEWFIQRYPMEVEEPEELAERAEEHRKRDDTIARILGEGYKPPKFELAVPPREYQSVAADLCLSTGSLLVADDLGIGKTATSICILTDERTLPALVVTLTHLPMQWKNEIAKFAPHLKCHIIKKGSVYDVTKGPRGRKDPFPDVFIINYHKLRGWAEHLAPVVNSVIFDECLRGDTEVLLWPLGRGTSRIDSIASGETIASFTEDGLVLPDQVHAVIAKGRRKVWRMTLLDGRSIVCTSNERFWTNHGWVYLQEIIDASSAKDTAKQAESADGYSSPDGAGDVAWRCKPYTAAEHEVRADKDAARSEPGKLLQAQGENPWGLRSYSTQDGSKSGVGDRELRLFDRNIAGLRLFGIDLLQHEHGGGSCKDRDVSVGARDRLASDCVLVHGRWVDAKRRSSAVLDSFVLGERSRNVGDSIRRSRSSGYRGANTEGAQVLLDNSSSLRVNTMPRREGATFYPFIDGLQVGVAADGQPEDLHGLRYRDFWRATPEGDFCFLQGTQVQGSRRACKESVPLQETTLRELGIASIELIGCDDVWDLETEQYHTFFANGIAVHNCQELRRKGTGNDLSYKYAAASFVSCRTDFSMGLSATPIYNYGGELFNVIDCLSDGALGTKEEFLREWCSQAYGSGDKAKIRDPKAFGSYLREQGIMLRRTRAEVGRELADLTIIPHTIECDVEALKKVEDSAAELANIILSQTGMEKGVKFQASERLSNILRQATGIAKAPYVAAFVQMLVDSGERVVLYGWHRAVYEIYLAQLKKYRPAMYTGSETTNQKLESKRRFVEGETDIMIISLRSGAGLDGLQYSCRTVVFGELDWSPGVHDQDMGRVHRDGQKEPVAAYFLIAEEGADPIIADVLGVKKQQAQGIMNPKTDLITKLQNDGGNARKLAEAFLRQRGTLPPGSSKNPEPAKVEAQLNLPPVANVRRPRLPKPTIVKY